MKAITGNHLADGRVVYLAEDGSWADHINAARSFDDQEADTALQEANARTTEITDAYLIEVEDGAPAGREALRERIRSAGPTVRRDLGKQAQGGAP